MPSWTGLWGSLAGPCGTMDGHTSSGLTRSTQHSRGSSGHTRPTIMKALRPGNWSRCLGRCVCRRRSPCTSRRWSPWRHMCDAGCVHEAPLAFVKAFLVIREDDDEHTKEYYFLLRSHIAEAKKALRHASDWSTWRTWCECCPRGSWGPGRSNRDASMLWIAPPDSQTSWTED